MIYGKGCSIFSNLQNPKIMNIKTMLLPEHSYIVVSFSILLLFATSSCVSDDITTNAVHNPDSDIEQTDDSIPPENPAPAFSLQTSYKYLLEIDVVVQLVRREFAMKYLISAALRYDSPLGFSSIAV